MEPDIRLLGAPSFVKRAMHRGARRGRLTSLPSAVIMVEARGIQRVDNGQDGDIKAS
jgi:hypothetical protein